MERATRKMQRLIEQMISEGLDPKTVFHSIPNAATSPVDNDPEDSDSGRSGQATSLYASWTGRRRAISGGRRQLLDFGTQLIERERQKSAPRVLIISNLGTEKLVLIVGVIGDKLERRQGRGEVGQGIVSCCWRDINSNNVSTKFADLPAPSTVPDRAQVTDNKYPGSRFLTLPLNKLGTKI
ncbi:hypothetical protein JB92DRAFT_3102862 [Gautieria morchelliformis]|nr:hypothetical protein JB92DRAFT_3102862 [Gautieria morchelliformis]